MIDVRRIPFLGTPCFLAYVSSLFIGCCLIWEILEWKRTQVSHEITEAEKVLEINDIFRESPEFIKDDFAANQYSISFSDDLRFKRNVSQIENTSTGASDFSSKSSSRSAARRDFRSRKSSSKRNSLGLGSSLGTRSNSRNVRFSEIGSVSGAKRTFRKRSSPEGESSPTSTNIPSGENGSGIGDGTTGGSILNDENSPENLKITTVVSNSEDTTTVSENNTDDLSTPVDENSSGVTSSASNSESESSSEDLGTTTLTAENSSGGVTASANEPNSDHGINSESGDSLATTSIKNESPTEGENSPGIESTSTILEDASGISENTESSSATEISKIGDEIIPGVASTLENNINLRIISTTVSNLGNVTVAEGGSDSSSESVSSTLDSLESLKGSEAESTSTLKSESAEENRLKHGGGLGGSNDYSKLKKFLDNHKEFVLRSLADVLDFEMKKQNVLDKLKDVFKINLNARDKRGAIEELKEKINEVLASEEMKNDIREALAELVKILGDEDEKSDAKMADEVKNGTE